MMPREATAEDAVKNIALLGGAASSPAKDIDENNEENIKIKPVLNFISNDGDNNC